MYYMYICTHIYIIHICAYTYIGIWYTHLGTHGEGSEGVCCLLETRFTTK